MKTVIALLTFCIMWCGCQRSGTHTPSTSISISDTTLHWDSSGTAQRHFTGGFKASDGLVLFYQGWEPVDTIKAIICLVHGFSEHSGRYATFSKLLNNAGFAVALFDLRGHGRSMGQRAHFPSLDMALNDISIFLAKTAALYPGRKIFLYGHSLGGDFVINYALRRHPTVAGVIASAPMLETAFKPPLWKLTLGKIMNGIWPSFSMPNPFSAEDITRDTAVQHSITNDPLMQYCMTASLVNLIDAGKWALAHANELSLPLLLMHGDADRVTSEPASAEFAKKAGKWCTFKVWPGTFHQIHDDPGKEEVAKYVTAWIEPYLH